LGTVAASCLPFSLGLMKIGQNSLRMLLHNIVRNAFHAKYFNI